MLIDGDDVLSHLAEAQKTLQLNLDRAETTHERNTIELALDDVENGIQKVEKLHR